MNIKRFFGDRAFYRSVLAIALPIMIQNAVSTFVNLLDNLMVGSLNTEAMSGVSIVNQFVFVFNISIFGAIAGAGIFASQFFGRGDYDGMKYAFRAKLIFSTLISVIGIGVFIALGDTLIASFLHSGTEGDLELTAALAKEYLTYIIIGLFPFAISISYASTLREAGETVVPMISSLTAVLTNCVLNAILIFGLLGAPAMGVAGAAIATTVSRFVELFILVIWSHSHAERCPFIKGLYSSLHIPATLMKQLIIKSAPLLINEIFWSIGITVKNQCYSTRGLDVVAALSIVSTIVNFLTVAYMAVGTSVGIVVGAKLGAGQIEEAKDTDRKMITLSFIIGLCITALQIAIAPIFPMAYNTTDSVRSLTSELLVISALALPFNSVSLAAYFTLRSGGNAVAAMLYDSMYTWVVILPVLFVFTYLTSMNIIYLFIVASIVESLKALLGLLMLKNGKWAKQIVIKREG